MKTAPNMKINTISYLILHLILTFGPLLVIIVGFTGNIFKLDNQLLWIAGVIVAAFATLAVSSYFLSPALIFIALQEGRQRKTTAIDALGKTRHLRLRMFRLKFIVWARFMTKILPFVIPAFAYAARISLWPYYLVDKNLPKDEALHAAYINSGSDAAKLFGKTVVFSNGWWHALEYLNRQKA